GIVTAPVIGALIDRWDRRQALMLSDAGGAIVAIVLVVLFRFGQPQVWQLYILVALGSICRAGQVPALMAAITLLVAKQRHSRAAGLVQAVQAVALVVGPPAGAALLLVTSVSGVVLVDFATYLFALATLALVRVPAPPDLAGAAGQRSLLREGAAGWSYLQERPALVGLLAFLAVMNFTLAVVQALITPMILDFSGAAVLGTVLSVGSVGLLLGNVVVSLWGGPARRVRGMLCSGTVFGLAGMASGLRASMALIAAAFFVALFAVPFIQTSSQAILLAKVAPAIQGRVFAMRQMVAWSAISIGYLVAGPLADRVFKPLLGPGGRLVPTLGPLLGVGAGRGIGLLFMVMGGMAVTASLLGQGYAPLRELEQRLPDAAVAPGTTSAA
ncbi:MAG TPA: MFS transporter, partial [Thermoanaerobaculia bacterium]